MVSKGEQSELSVAKCNADPAVLELSKVNIELIHIWQNAEWSMKDVLDGYNGELFVTVCWERRWFLLEGNYDI